MTSTPHRLLSAILITTCSLIASAVAQVPSVGGRIVDDVSAYIEDGTIKLRLEFLLPVHYQWRFPKEFGSLLLISLQPVKQHSELGTNKREHIRIPNTMSGLLNDMYIDGTEGSNLLLVIDAKREINPAITQARFASGIILSFSKDQIRDKPGVESEPKSKAEEKHVQPKQN